MAKKPQDYEDKMEAPEVIIADTTLYGYAQDEKGNYRLLKVPFNSVSQHVVKNEIKEESMNTNNRSEAVYQFKIALARNGMV